MRIGEREKLRTGHRLALIILTMIIKRYLDQSMLTDYRLQYCRNNTKQRVKQSSSGTKDTELSTAKLIRFALHLAVQEIHGKISHWKPKGELAS